MNKKNEKKMIKGIFYLRLLHSLILLLFFSNFIFHRCFCQQVIKEGARIIKSSLPGFNFFNEINLNEIEVNLMMNLGLFYWKEGDISKSLEIFEKCSIQAASENLIKKNHMSGVVIKIIELYLEGKKLRNKNNLDASIEQFQHAVNLARLYKLSEFEVKCLRQWGVSCWERGDYQNFHKNNETAFALAKGLNNRREMSKCLNNMGLYKWKTCCYSEALNLYHDALNIICELGNKSDESDCLNNLGIIYKEIGNYQKSLEYLNEALQIDRSLQNELNVLIDLNNIGTTLIRKGDTNSDFDEYKQALEFFEEGMMYAEKIKRNDIILKIANNIGLVYMKMDEYQKALKFFEVGYETLDSLDIQESKYILLNNLGMVFMKLGDFNRAEKYFSQVINTPPAKLNHEVLIESYYGLGLLANQKKQYIEALEFYKKSINAIEKIKKFIFLDEYKGGFSQYHMKVYWAAIELLCTLEKKFPNSGYMEDVFYLIEKSRANNVFERVFSLNMGIIQNHPSFYRKKTNFINSKFYSLSKGLLNAEFNESERLRLHKKIKKLEDEYKALLSQSEFEPELKIDSLHFDYCRLNKIQEELLDEKTALIEYYLGDKRSLLFLITKDKFLFFTLPSKKIINKSVKTYLKYLIEKRDKWNDFNTKKHIRSYLFPLFILNGDIFKKIENLIVIPDGMLHFFPFEVLNCRKPLEEYKYLIERFNISYAPSASSLLLLRNQRVQNHPKKVFLGIGDPIFNNKKGEYRSADPPFSFYVGLFPGYHNMEFSPLPHSKKEITEISKLFPEKNKEVLLGEDASEYKIKHIGLDDYACIHFASHSYLDPYSPTKSAIILSSDENYRDEDGILQIYEIYNFRLNAELVVLSACQTGLGELVESEGAIGLPRVFLYSGARSVVLSLWQIEDKSTARFMEYFYENLSKGSNKSEALRLAKMRMINSKLSHPYYWGAFILSGDHQIKYDLF